MTTATKTEAENRVNIIKLEEIHRTYWPSNDQYPRIKNISDCVAFAVDELREKYGLDYPAFTYQGVRTMGRSNC